ncbi:hypothetical protein vBYenM636_22 [Yersinia phage vB_YenM_636]|nr:hypothetical protein X1_35 [Yersinia phage vB_Yen_X1]QKN86273.1 hypothetical protein vBYenM12_22 [Yersinia phage vB_YenM_12]QKN86364.1 hypothetical protein vBYenM22_22 [Yersinia phage vB_YenM_22]QKN86455.1 hypothetical protein vBYenM25_22 [Yersinia phage vB_YenM_25]QKN86546.1 hypothetical protein vBYenM27_22 [Yersinia phage vB_YenM_27]QKN86637.1 hypothetical protein vBYenM39_22 [Yersinia phage vB_YenM_39]QKN86728.1 hypothetical protein vBYenM126_22 [Yersinia phage vB_YenM_126]QKN86819.1 h
MEKLTKEEINDILINIKDDETYMGIVEHNKALSDISSKAIERLQESFKASERALDVLKSARDAGLEGDNETASIFVQDYYDLIMKAREKFDEAMRGM